MCVLLTEGLSALQCSAQEPWREDRTVTSGSKALGIMAGPGRVGMLHSHGRLYMPKRTSVSTRSLYVVEALFLAVNIKHTPGKAVLRMATVKAFDLNGLGLNALLSARTMVIMFGIWLAYRVAIALYNISPLHPLYRFPGPKLAAMGFFYEGYYDWILVGRYGHEIRRMHEKYGTVFSPKRSSQKCPCY